MEEKKIDYNVIVGFVLIFVIVIWMMYSNAPTQEELDKKAKQEQAETKKKEAEKLEKVATPVMEPVVNDSITSEKAKSQLGAFAYSASVSNIKPITINNGVLTLVFSPKGGYITEALVNNFSAIDKNNPQKVQLINKNNASFNLQLHTQDSRTLDTKNLIFEPILSKEGQNQIVTMRLKTSPNQYLEYKYVIKPKEYMIDFSVRTQGLKTSLNTNKPITLEWDMKTFRNEKSISYENRYTELIYEYENGKDDYMGQGENDTDQAEDVTYVAYKQHLFTSILLTNTAFKKADFVSDNLVKDEEKDTIFMKKFSSKIPLEFQNGELNYAMNWYYGPSDYKILNSYNRNLDEIIPLGWGIFGWLNRFVFIPIFGFLATFFPYGIAIILLTVVVKLVLSPITYKSFVSQAKMKVLRPEIQEINEKYSKDAMKRQQETMSLYTKAGVNPMAGCIPALLQLPVFYALFQFFPSVFDLRQKGFLWADDLSSYDAVIQLPFTIPFYGNHISLFPILASVAIFFYMKMTTGDQAMSAPPQEGMPDMSKIMKMMLYISPIMMLIFFNNYASGLSLYNFVSNLITIGIIVIIKKYVIDEDKIHAQIQVNKQKPKKQSKFQQRMQEMMEKAQEQQRQNKK